MSNGFVCSVLCAGLVFPATDDVFNAATDEDLPLLVKSLVHEEVAVRDSAIRALSRIATGTDGASKNALRKHRKKITPLLLKVISITDVKPDIWIYALGTILDMGGDGSDALATLIAIIESKNEEHQLRRLAILGTRIIALRTPQQLIAIKANQTLIRVYKDKDETHQTREEAAFHICQLRPCSEQAATAFIHVLNDKHDKI